MKLLPKIKTPCWKRCADVASTMSASKNGIDAPSRYCFTGVFILLLLLSCSKPILTVSIPDVPEVIQSEQPLFKLGMPFETGSTVEDTKSMPVWVPVVLEAPAKRVLCSERIVVCVDTFSCDSLFRVCDRMLKKIDSLCCVADKIVKDNESFDLKYDQRKWQDTKRDGVLAIWTTGITGSVLLVLLIMLMI